MPKEKVIGIEKIEELIKESNTVMVSGFMGCGSPHKIIEKLVELRIENLTLICNDTGLPNYGVGKMVNNKQFSIIKTSHIGLNAESIRQLNSKETVFHIIPQGTLVEQIRCAGAGLGGFLTPTGIGTLVEEGKQVVEVDGKYFILEKPLKADVAIIAASKVDKKGNVYYKGAGRNFAPIMAMAAEKVIVEADEIVEVGEIHAEDVMTPHIFIDYIIDGGRKDG